MTKVIISTDWHFGAKGNKPIHNEQIFDFVKWKVEEANRQGIQYMFQLGDFFDVRDKIDVSTMNYAVDVVQWINENFNGEFYILEGNHDLYYKHRLDVSSLKCIEPYCNVIKENTKMEFQEDGKTVLLCPWICDAEHWDKTINESKDCDYLFGHLELTGYKMNDNYVMENGWSANYLSHLDRVLTGHYHKRQQKGNVIYIGNPFGFDFNDANDLERGFCTFDIANNELEYFDYHKVKVLSIPYNQLNDYKDQIDENTSLRIEFPDEDVADEDLEKAQEFIEERNLVTSKIKYQGNKATKMMESDVQVEEVENIDESVLKSIEQIEEIQDIDKDMLKRQYKQAIDYEENVGEQA